MSGYPGWRDFDPEKSATPKTGAKRARAHRGESKLEAALMQQLAVTQTPLPRRELMLVPGRRWRCDMTWEVAVEGGARGLVVEIDGGGYVQGRHSRGAGMDEDGRKVAALQALGYRVLRVTGTHVKSGEALAWIRRELGLERPAAGPEGA